MKKVTIKVITLVTLSVLLVACGSTKNYGEKLRAKNFKQKVKELQREGWKIHSSTKTMELSLYDHFQKMDANPNIREMQSEVSMCRSMNVCRANAINNALREYADLAGSTVKGKAVTDMRNNSSAMQPEEFDNFYSAYVRNVKKEIKGEIIPSYAIYKENGAGKTYRMVFLLDEDEASESRKRAMKRALEETKLSIEYGLWVEKFVNETPQTK